MYIKIMLFLGLINAFLCIENACGASSDRDPILVHIQVMPAKVEIAAPCARSEVDTLEKLQKVTGQLIHMHNVRDRMSMVYGEVRSPIPMAKAYKILAGTSKLDTPEALARVLATLEGIELRKLSYHLLALTIIIPKA